MFSHSISLVITRHQSYLLIYDQTPHKHAQKQAKTNFSCFSPSRKGSAATKQYTRLHGPIGRSSRPVRVYRCRVIPSWQSRPCIKARRSAVVPPSSSCCYCGRAVVVELCCRAAVVAPRKNILPGISPGENLRRAGYYLIAESRPICRRRDT